MLKNFIVYQVPFIFDFVIHTLFLIFASFLERWSRVIDHKLIGKFSTVNYLTCDKTVGTIFKGKKDLLNIMRQFIHSLII